MMRRQNVRPLTINRPELFLIPHDTIMALSHEEVGASYDDMVELGIANLPYPKTDIGISMRDWLYPRNGRYSSEQRVLARSTRLYGESDPEVRELRGLLDRAKAAEAADDDSGLLDTVVRIRFEHEKLVDIITRYYGQWGSLLHDDDPDEKRVLIERAELYRRALIVLLATRNAIKTRVENKRLRLGIGKSNQNNYRYTTTITIPPSETLESETGSNGVSPRPHLRRGHIRRQRYGPKLDFVERIWVEPCFVNADPGFISARTAYNASLRSQTPIAGLGLR